MKNFLLAGFLAVIGSLAFVPSAQAAGRYCFFNPDDPICDPFYYDGGGYGDGYPPPRPHHVYEDPFFGDNYDTGPVISLHFGNNRNRCNAIASSLRRSGYRAVRAVDCAGRDYAFIARRDGQRLKIGVASGTGRINSIRPY
jgi:hypothetical protein